MKQVYASLWNFRAFVQRDFYRIDHLKTAMGVLVHPNYSDELVNGVAVSFDPVYGRDNSFYVNSQMGEDLITNPEARSTPEEILLHTDSTYTVTALSNQAPRGQLLMDDGQLAQLRRSLNDIHDHFHDLYEVSDNADFAIEIEFKITSDNILSIKQARPWVFPVLTGRIDQAPATHNGAPFSSHPAVQRTHRRRRRGVLATRRDSHQRDGHERRTPAVHVRDMADRG